MSKILESKEEYHSRYSSAPPNASPPIFEGITGNENIVQGSTARFQCRISGNPAPQVSWTKRGVPLVSDNR